MAAVAALLVLPLTEKSLGDEQTPDPATLPTSTFHDVEILSCAPISKMQCCIDMPLAIPDDGSIHMLPDQRTQLDHEVVPPRFGSNTMSLPLFLLPIDRIDDFHTPATYCIMAGIRCSSKYVWCTTHRSSMHWNPSCCPPVDSSSDQCCAPQSSCRHCQGRFKHPKVALLAAMAAVAVLFVLQITRRQTNKQTPDPATLPPSTFHDVDVLAAFQYQICSAALACHFAIPVDGSLHMLPDQRTQLDHEVVPPRFGSNTTVMKVESFEMLRQPTGIFRPG
eukprot:CAMPEP_0119571728 /NCGR_PEP_ID=MMETSP1352-20130426/44266_1 /TAXON_ID=265584 /ORGANISM="Stauroneis constricta, Strain CCMP1120" /LENGTH=277 /DNA_ID=CAMNT_0007621411 /DNA_START=368 /DNA_END=1203 /DNA_ORIENTATION=+